MISSRRDPPPHDPIRRQVVAREIVRERFHSRPCVFDNVDALVRHLPGQANPIDVVIAALHPDPTASLESGVTLVTSPVIV